MRECPFCFRTIGDDAVECPNCGRRIDVFRTGYFSRPDLSRPKTALIWVAAIVILGLLAVGVFRGCVTRGETPSAGARR